MANTLRGESQPETLRKTEVDYPSSHQVRAFTLSFPPIDRETRAAVDTETAAYHLNRAPQTLRIWACKENGPLRPLRINGRLAWSTADIRRLLGVTG